MATTETGVFCGGDLAKIASTTVESVNDGKTAAWHMHRFIQVREKEIKISYFLVVVFFRIG
jgi:dihydropyrimidine dehydrogenase (NADP+)